ncbi:winged helix DNA-binding protein [Micromonospora pisi]|uniref:Winged helix DNA-binding protein n=1 Tax=Micromonospora pisi TaxID=589240 RepID=A0A495JBS1_9ACTN|nr:winged helix DNA-binding protein [Micromonospora pisi]
MVSLTLPAGPNPARRRAGRGGAGNLSKHLSVLETAGLIEVEKGYEGRRGRTWITLTADGGTALAEEIKRLKLLITKVETAGTPEDR